MCEQRKRCTKCGVEKALNAFYLRGGKPIAACKDCTKAQVAKYQAKHPEKVSEWSREHRARHSERETARTAAWAKGPGREKRRLIKQRSDARHKEARAAEYADWYARNNAEIRARAKARYDPDKKRESRKPEKGRLYLQRRRARLLAAYVEDTPFDAVLQRDVGRCGICGAPIMEVTIELDHIIPLAAGGMHEMKNIQLAHRTCNRQKGTSSTFSLL